MGKEDRKLETMDVDTAEEMPGGSSRLGKEAKIGVAVIGLLVVVLGVVMAMRMMNSGSDEQVAAVPEPDGVKEHEKPKHDSKLDVLSRENHQKPFGSNSILPTVVPPAKTASTTPPKTITSDLDRWKITSDRHDGKRNHSGASLDAPPLSVPDAPKPPKPDRQDPYALDSLPDSPTEHGKNRHKGNTDLRLASPDVPPARSNRWGNDADDSSGFATVEPAAPPAPLREPPRYGSMPSSRAGSSYPAGPDRSTNAMPVGQYDANDYRHAPSGGRRHSTSSLNNPPPQRDDGKYEVQPNDSYWTISERLYGTGAYFKALAQQNRGKGGSEDQLQPGSLILAPTVAELEKSYPDLCPKANHREAMQSQNQSRVSNVSTRNQYRGGRTYTVAEGDTLFNIARYELGKASRWAEIYELNRDVLGKDFNYLAPGTQLTLPDGEKSDVIAQPPRDTYRR
jgi:nucleoid-associated protein YgaU